MLSQRTQLLTASATLAMNSLAKERQREGLPVYNLSTGEPEITTPVHIREAAKRAIDDGYTHYTAAGGSVELKKAIQQKYVREMKITYEMGQITCSNGAKEVLYHLFQVLLNDGDEVLCADPFWLSYKTQVELAGGVLVPVPTLASEGFSLKAADFFMKVSEKTKVILLNSPSNPSGNVIEEDELRKIGALAMERGIIVVSDDVYEYFYYMPQKPKHLLEIMPELQAQTVVVNSVSKTYAMTGWRLGWAGGPRSILEKMEELQSHAASNPCSISQKAAIAALDGPQEHVEEMRLSFVKRREFLVEAFARQNRFQLIAPQGAFYAMIDVKAVLQNGESDEQFCADLLKKTGVTLVPGSPFGEQGKGFARMSFAVEDEILHKAVEILLKFRAE